MGCPHQIPPSGTAACHQRLKSHTWRCTRSTSHHCHQGQIQTQQIKVCSAVPKDITVTVTMIPTEAMFQVHIVETVDVTTGVLHNSLTPVLIVHCHCDTPHHRSAFTQELINILSGTRADHNPIQHTNQVSKPCISLQHIPAELQDKLHDKGNPRVMIDDPQMDFYSSDDNSSYSEDDPDHLN